jgi:hypothetical protein
MPPGFEKVSLKGDKGKGNDHKGDKEEDNAYPPKKENYASPPPPGPHSNEPPPAYAAVDPSRDPPPVLLTTGFADLQLPTKSVEFPTTDQALAHLKLLNALHILKEDVGYTDGLFGISNSLSGQLACDTDEALAKIREKRWLLYVARAAGRFEDWWLKVLWPKEGGARLRRAEMIATNPEFVDFTKRGQAQNWTTAELPPLGLSTIEASLFFTNHFARYPNGLACIRAQS